jgi:hypothetical protein
MPPAAVRRRRNTDCDQRIGGLLVSHYEDCLFVAYSFLKLFQQIQGRSLL